MVTTIFITKIIKPCVNAVFESIHFFVLNIIAAEADAAGVQNATFKLNATNIVITFGSIPNCVEKLYINGTVTSTTATLLQN